MSYDSLPSLKTLFATVTAGVTGTLVYHYMKTKFFAVNDEENIKVSVHVEVPQQTVAYLIGRGGNNIKHIEEETCTSISFIDPGGPCRLGVIRGSKEGVQLAKLQLLKCVEEYGQLETCEIFVSETTIAWLTSEESKKLREIAALSKTRIYIDGQEKPMSLLVRGTYHQIENARECLKTRLKEMAVEDVQSETDTSKNSMVNHVPNPVKTKSQLSERAIDFEILDPTSSDGFCEVMVSVVESPSKFFVQKCGTLSKDLDCLIDDMTEFYSKGDNRLQYAAPKIEIGNLVATLIPDDSCWYRAKVVSIEPDEESDEEETILSVNLVDFGDTVKVKQCYVASLRPDFLTIQFQSIECRMAYIQPKDGVEWSEKAIEVFETLTYCAHWKILMARVESHATVNDRNVYSLKLVDTNTETDIDIAAELVRLEFGCVVDQELSM